MSDKKFKVGDKVRYIGKNHKKMPEFYPEIGTVGAIVKESGDTDWYIQWPKGSTSKEDCWYCDKNDVELVENEDMTNEEIWDFLKNKMSKNGLVSKVSIINTHVEDYPNNKVEIIKVYHEDDVHNAIALAYKVGYLRSQKGRPFKFGEKKKKGGHWEPIDPKNLPKEGTKVRYSRFCEYHPAIPDANKVLSINSIGTVLYKYKKFGVEVNNSWCCSSRYPERFDMWVEDDE